MGYEVDGSTIEKQVYEIRRENIITDSTDTIAVSYDKESLIHFLARNNLYLHENGCYVFDGYDKASKKYNEFGSMKMSNTDIVNISTYQIIKSSMYIL